MNKWMVLIFLLCIAGLTAPMWREQDAKFYFERGSETAAAAGSGNGWFHRWNLNSARADFSHAIKLNPKFTAAYSGRAAVEFRNGDLGGAIKDYTTLIELNPQAPENYLARAGAEEANHQFESALADYAKVIELTPDNRAAFRGRMRVKESQNDFVGAVMERVHMMETVVPGLNGGFPTNSGNFAGRYGGRGRGRILEQLDRALVANTNFAWGYYYRGVVKALDDDRTNALADFQQCGNFPDGKLKDDAAIQIWLVQTQAGERERADQGLLAYCQSRTQGTPTDWQMHIAQFLLNQTSETDFRGAIDTSDTGREESEFWYYTGMKRLWAGDKVGAGDCLRKSLTTKTRPYAVFLSAMAALRSLDSAAAANTAAYFNTFKRTQRYSI